VPGLENVVETCHSVKAAVAAVVVLPVSASAKTRLCVLAQTVPARSGPATRRVLAASRFHTLAAGPCWVALAHPTASASLVKRSTTSRRAEQLLLDQRARKIVDVVEGGVHGSLSCADASPARAGGQNGQRTGRPRGPATIAE
jgi:hypothetical protein